MPTIKKLCNYSRDLMEKKPVTSLQHSSTEHTPGLKNTTHTEIKDLVNVQQHNNPGTHEKNENIGEKRFNEGLADNSHTEIS